MHGRIKVKTTAEQQEAKKLEREKKLKLYTAATNRIFEKRKNGEYDEEGLKLTGDILAMNSDFSTLWNYRKEIFLHMKDNRSAEEVCELFKTELQFLESCLRGNPKSYGVWNHRCFVMDTMAEPDWKKELQLCNLFLEYDERNFHCWDYRRFVVERSNVPPKAELEFTQSKICNNFSNFSSWHYRSKLLPLIYPDDSTAVGVEENVLIKEYEAVQNAFFTDPDDQSAWFYHRWLLGRGKKKPGVSCMFVSRDHQSLMINTTQPVLITAQSCEVEVLVNGEHQPGRWCTHKHQDNAYSNIWIFTSKDGSPWLPGKDEVEVQVAADAEDWGSSDSVQLQAGQPESWTLTQDDQGLRFRHELSAATTDTLQRELQSIQELYDLEPENKWVLLTIVSLMKALDPLKYSEQIETFISQLKTIDSTRLHYYEDLRSRYILENYLEEFDFDQRVVSLASRSLTCVYHADLLSMVVKVDLSHNCLTSVKGFSCLQCAREVILDDNKIEEVEELRYLKDLSQLSLKNNSIPSIDVLDPLVNCHHLIKLHVSGNPMSELSSHTDVKHLLPSLHNVDGHIFG
ncbi:geranylgeranyl transferase type-2 subunit alpha-like [Mya arenaria]|uniref:geranylgeranyl transferase type-2 subunit alpha-like n=1 Tax=Mya arenaria TaxID=6604 RepID=UPI0022E02797|nr:geranylgeranyl transferase type-2 subunit alpha-like [Mya arenaria]